MDKRTVENFVLRQAMRLPGKVKSGLAGPPVVVEGRQLDRETQFFLMLMAKANKPSVSEQSVAEAREEIDAGAPVVGGPPAPLSTVEERAIDGPASKLQVRIYRPEAGELPALLYYHGGGFVVGGLASHDLVCRRLAAQVGCIVIAVDYRLAPEHPFPAPVHDAIATYDWLVATAAELNIDPARIAVGGDSAGGNLATVVTHHNVRSGGPTPIMQLLLYPVTDLSRESRGYEIYADGFFLTRDDMRFYRTHYLEEDDGTDIHASPLLASDLSGHPPAYVATAGFDPLRFEGEAYAQRLSQAGVEVVHHEFEGLIHGYINFWGVLAEARSAFDDACIALRAAFGRP